MAQETEDQPAADAQQLAAIGQRGADAVERGLERYAAVGVGLRVEEGLGVHHVLLFALLQVGPGQVIEVLLGTQHVGASVVEIEELLQVAEVVGAAQCFDVIPGQGDLVALGQTEHQFRLQRALQVQVEFGLGQVVEPVLHREILVLRV